MNYESRLAEMGSSAKFPSFQGEKVYMRPFTKNGGLPADLSRWSELVASMLDGVDTELPIYLMIDQKRVKAGDHHRRPGLHIDGYWGGSAWSPLSAHGGDGGMPPRHRGTPTVDVHRSVPSWHRSTPTVDRHSPASPARHSAGASTWVDAPFAAPEAIILASNIAACAAYSGTFEGPIGEMGDCGHISTGGLQRIDMRPDTVYAGNVTMLHETLPCIVDCERTVVRLNVPGWSP